MLQQNKLKDFDSLDMNSDNFNKLMDTSSVQIKAKFHPINLVNESVSFQILFLDWRTVFFQLNI